MDSYIIISSLIGVAVLLMVISEFSPFYLLASGKFGLIVRLAQIGAVVGFFWSMFNSTFSGIAISVLLLIVTLMIEIKLYDKEKNTSSKE